MQEQRIRLIVTVIKVIVWLAPVLFGFHQWAYNKMPKYYFFVVKRFSKWRDTKWAVIAEYNIDKKVDFFREFENTVIKHFKSFNRTFNLKNKKQYEFADFSLIIQYDMDVSQSDIVKVEIIFNQMNVTYNNARTRLKELRILFNELEKTIRSDSQQYTMDIFFTTVKNPFYGLMIQRLGEEHVKDFECLFPISILEKKETGSDIVDEYLLRVFKNKITINEANFDNIEDIASKCLLLR